jgi:two-component system chemotaxis response regulator CheY
MAEQEAGELGDILENLENLEQSLMEFEDSLSAGEGDDSLIHFIFRYAHNLKSTLGMIHKHYSSELIHSVETQFDSIRSGKASATVELIDRTFTAIDLIKENLYQENESAEDLQALKEEFEALQKEEQEVNQVSIRFPLSREVVEKIQKAENDKYVIYQIEKMVKSELSEENLKKLPVYEDIEEVGFHITTYPPYKEIDRRAEEAVIKILFASNEDPKELFYTIFDPFRPVDTGSVQTTMPQDVEEKEQPKTKPISKKNKVKPAPSKPAGELDILIVEDDFVTRHLEVTLLGEYGKCDVAVNGAEAVAAFERRMLNNNPYDLVLLDILIPEMDGHAVLQRLRETEEEHGIKGLDRSKVVIVSNLQDMDNITRSFRGQSDSYIIKPVNKDKISRELKRVGLVT